MLLMSLVVVLSLIVTGTFVSLLFKSVETESLIKLRSNAEVTTSLLEEKKLRIQSEMKQFSLNSEVIKAVEDGNRQVLSEKIKKQMELTGAGSMVIVDSSGKVIIRGENEEEKGASLSSDKYIEKALGGANPAGYFVTSGTISPVVSLRLATGMTGGAIMTTYILDNVFVDGIKNSTGLAISLYGDKTLAATTEEIGNSNTRLSGIKEMDSEVLSRVWDKGEIYTTASTLGEREYLSAYVPLKDQNNEVMAVLQVAQQEVEAMQAAGQAVQMTFGFIILIMVILAWPLSMISKKLVKEWE
jgi:predicted DNA-binding protein